MFHSKDGFWIEQSPISGAAENAGVTIPEVVDYLVCKGYRSEYSVNDFRRGVTLLEKKLKEQK